MLLQPDLGFGHHLIVFECDDDRLVILGFPLMNLECYTAAGRTAHLRSLSAEQRFDVRPRHIRLYLVVLIKRQVTRCRRFSWRALRLRRIWRCCGGRRRGIFTLLYQVVQFRTRTTQNSQKQNRQSQIQRVFHFTLQRFLCYLINKLLVCVHIQSRLLNLPKFLF